MLISTAPARLKGRPPRQDSRGGNIVGRIQKRAFVDRAPRWALYKADGSLSNTFAADLNRDGVAALLRQHRLTLRADNTVVTYAPPVPLDPEKIAAAKASHDAVKATFADARRAAA